MKTIEPVRDYVQKNLTAYDDDYCLGNDDLIFELGFVDSVFAVQLVGFLEKQFHVTVLDTDLDLDNFSSVNHIVAFIDQKQKRE